MRPLLQLICVSVFVIHVGCTTPPSNVADRGAAADIAPKHDAARVDVGRGVITRDADVGLGRAVADLSSSDRTVDLGTADRPQPDRSAHAD